MFAQKLPGERIDQADLGGIPLHLYAAPNPSWRRAIVSGFHFDVAIQVHGAFAVLVIAERFEQASYFANVTPSPVVYKKSLVLRPVAG